MANEQKLLREYISAVLLEGGWEDPSVVYAHENPHQEDLEPDEAESGTKFNLDKSVEDNANLHQRGNSTNDNKNMASMKPIAPSNKGGPQSGRMPGNRSFTPGVKSYNAGF